jgi:transposase InsO family protein
VHRLRFQHKIKTLCRVLAVNRSSYYKRFHSQPADRTVENQRLRGLILQIYNDAKQRFGIHKIRQRLKTEYGIIISAGRVYRLMKTMDLPKMSTLKPRQMRRICQEEGAYSNTLNRQFNPQKPNLAWVSDFTYIKVKGRFVYVCVVIDLYARKLIAWKVSEKANETLVCDTLLDAYQKRGEPKNVLFHSDRGCQYTAFAFRRMLDQLGFIQSYSRKGTPYDNAVAESFFKFLKLEQTNRCAYNNLRDLEVSMFEYANFYNRHRPHSANEDLTPDQKERAFAQTT